MKALYPLRSVLLAVLMLSISSCSTEELSDITETSRLQVKISATDSNFDALFLDFKEIHLKMIDDESDPDCWWKVSSLSGVHNLSDLTSGNFALLADGVSAPSGMVYEIKIVLGDNNVLVKDGRRYELFTNVIQLQNLQMRTLTNFIENKTYVFNVEFNTAASVVQGPISDQFIFRPVVNFSFY